MVQKPDSLLEVAPTIRRADADAPPLREFVEISGDKVTVPDAHLLFNGAYARQLDDLVLTGADGTAIVLLNFFGQGHPVDLYSPQGAMVPFALATQLAGPQAPGLYAQAGKAVAAQPIGQVESLTGTATAKRTDGTVVKLTKGALLFKGDVVQTGPNSEMGITFVDKTVFSLSAQARMVLNELVYNPAAKNNSMLLNLVEGSFVFVAGQVAGSGDMKVETPVATMGIRGTTVIVRVEAKDGTTYTSLAKDPDGTTGRFEIVSKLTNQVLGTVTETSNKWVITSADGNATELAKTTNDIATDLNAVSFIYNVYKASSDRIKSGQEPVNQSPPNPKPDGDRGDAPDENPQQQANNGDPVPGSGVKTNSDGLGLVVDAPEGLGNPNPPPPGGAGPLGDPNQPPAPGVQPPGNGGSQNSAPVITISGGAVEIFQDQSTTISGLSVSDPDGGSLTVSISAFSTVTLAQKTGLSFLVGDGTSDEQMTFTGTAAAINAALSGLTYTPTSGNVGSGGLNITVSDTVVSTSASFVITINAAATPVVSNVLLNVLEDGIAQTGDFAVTDPDSTTHTFQFSPFSPEMGGALVNNGNGTFSFNPLSDFQYLGAGETEVLSFEYTATDEGGRVSDPAQVFVTVSGVNDPPELDNEIPDQNATEDTQFNFVLPANTFSDVDNPSLTLSATLTGGGALPGWLNFNPATGTFTGTPLDGDDGVVSIRVTADDGDGGSVSDDFDIFVNPQNDAPVIFNPFERAYDAVIANFVHPTSGTPEPNQVFFGDENGDFVNSGQALGSGFSLGVALGDLNGDGFLDAFFANRNSQSNTVFLNDGLGILSQQLQGFDGIVANNSTDVKLGDFDGDGDLDAFVTNTADEGNEVYLNDGNGQFSATGANLGASHSTAVALGDVNGDGHLDAVVANISHQSNKVYLGDGTGQFSDVLPSFDNNASRDIALGDVDSDGDLDAIVANVNGNPTRLYLNDGFGNFSDSLQNLSNNSDEAVVVGDIDNDGDVDIVLTATSGFTNAVWFNDGGGNFTNSSQNLHFPGAQDLALKDLDNDGDQDLFVVNDGTVADQVFLNDGTGFFTDSGQALGVADGNAVALGDLTSNNAPKPLETTQGQPALLKGIQFSDPDAGNGEVTVTLSALGQRGTISVKDDIPTVVANISGNGTSVVTITATLAQLQNIFVRPDAVQFMPDIDFLGVETIEIEIDDNGHTGGIEGGLTDTSSIHVTVKQPLPINFAELGETNINGRFAGDQFGTAVSGVGDINNDGFDDVIVGAQFSDAGGVDRGYSTVIFGAATLPGDIDAATIFASQGFNASGIAANNQSGSAVSAAGDINNDGIADIFNGAVNGDAGGPGSGEAYIRFGGQAFSNSESFSGSLTSGNFQGFNLDGDVSFDRVGESVAGVGDVTGDGIDDLLVGASGAFGSDGRAYLVKGGSTIPTFSVNLANLNGNNGYVFNDANPSSNGEFGKSVAGAGDVNGDGINDVLFGAPAENGTGEVFLVFGGDGNLGSIDGFGPEQGRIDLQVLDGISGYTFHGIAPNDATGISVAGNGDTDGDGFDDLLFSANRADLGPDVNQGISYLVFGGTANLFDLDTADAATDGEIDLSNFDATHGFKFVGRTYGDHRSGTALDFAGDLNGDGYDDIVIATSFSDGPNGTQPAIGEIFVISGGRHNLEMLDNPVVGLRDGIIDLDNLAPLRAVSESGLQPGALFGFSVSGAGDVNGDGYDDLIVGEPGIDTGAGPNSGGASILFGGDTLTTTTHQGTTGADGLAGTANRDVIIGGLHDDHLEGKGGADTIRGGAGNDAVLVDDLSFKKVDGGTGQDVLLIRGVDIIDLRTIADNRIESFEALSIEDGQSNTLTLGISDVFNLSEVNDTSLEDLLSGVRPNSATIGADSGDTVQLADDPNGGWVENLGLAPLVPGFTLYDYASGGNVLATLAVDDDASVVVLPAFG